MKALIYRVLYFIFCLNRWIYSHIFGWIFYDKKYLTGKCFSNGIYSIGWQWMARDIHYRMHSFRHMHIRWPVAPHIETGDGVEFDPDDLGIMNSPGYRYFQTIHGKIKIGKGSYFASNIGIISTNHNLDDPNMHQDGKDVTIGESCWIGMNVVVLPGVILGPHTVVGAGAVVTKSFPEGYCVIGGNPARLIKKLVGEKKCMDF